MATFISTLKFTAQGTKNLQQSPERAEKFMLAAQAQGIKVLGLYWTFGSFDGAIVFEAPDETVAAAAMFALAAEGNVQTSTSRAFDRVEIQKVLGSMPK